MYTFPELIRKIRDESGLTQTQFAKALRVSPVLVAMVETGQKEVSKKFLLKLAELMRVHPSSITPFLFTGEKTTALFGMEKQFIKWGESFQNHLIKNRSRILKKYATG